MAEEQEAIREIDEEAFYGYVNRSYLLEGDNLRGLYDRLCGDLSIHSSEGDNGIYTSEGIGARIFTEEKLRVTIYYNIPSQPRGIYIELHSFVGGAVLPDRAVNLVKFVEKTTKENKFKPISSDKNEF